MSGGIPHPVARPRASRPRLGWRSPTGLALPSRTCPSPCLRPGLTTCLGGVLALGLLSACAPDSGYVGPAFPFSARYQGAAGTPVLLSNDLWWHRLDDLTLDRLVDVALEGSPSVAAAQARLDSARALLGTVGVDTSGAGSASATTDLDGNTSLTFDASLSHLFDPGGALRAERRSAAAGADIAQAQLDATRLALLAAVVDGYLDLRYRQQILVLRKAELEDRRGTLEATRKLVLLLGATRLDTLRAEARVADIEAELPGLEASVATAATSLTVLTGRAPGDLPDRLGAALASTGPQPRATLSPEVGIPTDLLRNRPDLQLAERRYYAAVVGIDAARAALYPRLSLRGSLSVDALAGGGAAFVFGPALQLPAIPQGPARAGVAAREAEARAAAEDWRGAVLAALGEVETALMEHRAAAQAEEAARRAARLNGEALDLTRRLFDREAATLGEVFDAETAVAQAEARLAAQTLDRARAFAALNLRLGAGHDGRESTQAF